MLDSKTITKYNKILDNDSSLEKGQIDSIVISLTEKMDANLKKHLNQKKIKFYDVIPYDEYSLLLQVEEQLPFVVIDFIENQLEKSGRKINIFNEDNKFII